jgi:folylpolyglutamate synthase/dihydropteroate synthase
MTPQMLLRNLSLQPSRHLESVTSNNLVRPLTVSRGIRQEFSKPALQHFRRLKRPQLWRYLQQRASDKGVNLQFVDVNPYLSAHIVHLELDVQRMNCLVALACVQSFLDQKTNEKCSRLSPSDVLQGISQFSRPGRFQLL